MRTGFTTAVGQCGDSLGTALGKFWDSSGEGLGTVCCHVFGLFACLSRLPSAEKKMPCPRPQPPMCTGFIPRPLRGHLDMRSCCSLPVCLSLSDCLSFFRGGWWAVCTMGCRTNPARQAADNFKGLSCSVSLAYLAHLGRLLHPPGPTVYRTKTGCIRTL